jgi:hypothetical protein
MDGEHGPFDIPIVGMVDDGEDAPGRRSIASGASALTVMRMRGRLQSPTSGASESLVIDPLIARIQLELLWTRANATTARVCRLAQLREQNRRRLDARRGQNWTPHHIHVTTRGTRVERPMRAMAASLAAAASGYGGSACASLTKAAL